MIKEIDTITIRHLNRILPKEAPGSLYVLVCFTIDGEEFVINHCFAMGSFPHIDRIDWAHFNEYQIGASPHFIVKTIGFHGGQVESFDAMSMTHFLAHYGVLI